MQARTLEALEGAAAIDRRGDWGLGLRRPSVVASPSGVRKLRARIVAFLREMPDDMTVYDLIEELND